MAATFSAGFIKLFDASPTLGFLAEVDSYNARIAAGGTAQQIAEWGTRRFNAIVKVVVTSFFLVAVSTIFLGCLREWVKLLSGRKVAVLQEDPYVPLVEAV